MAKKTGRVCVEFVVVGTKRVAVVGARFVPSRLRLNKWALVSWSERGREREAKEWARSVL